MSRLLKLKTWITILLLGYSIDSLGSRGAIHPFLSTGELSEDSVTIAISDLKIANAKMVELKYQKNINLKLNQIISNDSIVIRSQSDSIDKLSKENKLIKKQRNILGGSTVASLLLLIISLF